MTELRTPPPGSGGPPPDRALATRGPHPWRLVDESASGSELVFERRLFDAGGRAVGVSREAVDVSGGGLAPAFGLALAAWVLLGKLSPADLRSVVEEVRATGAAGAAPGLARLSDAIGPAARSALDDPMDGVLTGPLQRALAGRGATLVEALEHVAARPDARDVLVYVDVFVRSRRALLALALRLARELPPFPTDVLDGSVDLFAWYRERGAREAVLDVAGEPFVVPVPADLPEPAATAAAASLGELLSSVHRDAERLAHPRRDFSGVARDVALELLDGLAGLLVNGLCLGRAPRPGEVASTLEPAGRTPTRARHVRSVTIAGAPFHDALGRFFAVPSTHLVLPRTGRSVAVRRTGTCPFAESGWNALGNDVAG